MSRIRRAPNSRYSSNAGVWKLKANADTDFDHETEDLIKLKVESTDGGSTILTAPIDVTINDIDENPTGFTLNDGLLIDGTNAGHVQGQTIGSMIGVLKAVDQDTNPAFKPNAADYAITSLSATGLDTGTLSASDFEIIDVTRDGVTDTILKVKDTRGKIDFGNGSLTIEIKLDAEGNGIGTGTDIPITFTLSGRDDVMILESVDGKQAFMSPTTPASSWRSIRFQHCCWRF